LRRLITGDLAEEYSEAIDLKIHTKCPSKWLLVDLETGQTYVGSNEDSGYGKWHRSQKQPIYTESSL
jgi:hypothetical protein